VEKNVVVDITEAHLIEVVWGKNWKVRRQEQ
jgi:hypothetical protein